MKDATLEALVSNFLDGKPSATVKKADLLDFVKRVIERDEEDDGVCGNCGAGLRECEACGAG